MNVNTKMLPIILLLITEKESVFYQDAFRIYKEYSLCETVKFKTKEMIMEWNVASHPLDPSLIVALAAIDNSPQAQTHLVLSASSLKHPRCASLIWAPEHLQYCRNPLSPCVTMT